MDNHESITSGDPQNRFHGSAGAKALLGASPFAAGAPANQAHPLVLDMCAFELGLGQGQPHFFTQEISIFWAGVPLGHPECRKDPGG